MAAANPNAVRAYRDFLTPVLHRRFTSAAVWSLMCCYAIAIWQSEFDILWSWLPLGPTGVRTAFLFIAVLMSYVLHISQLHVSENRSASQFQDFLRNMWSWQALNTILWYTFSAVMFSEAYIWSQDQEANLKIVDPGRPYERPRLNERPIYLRTLFMILGIQQAFWHLFMDKSRVKTPARKIDLHTGEPIKRSPRSLLKDSLIPIVVDVTTRMVVVSVVAPALYSMFLRHTAWHWNLAVAKKVFTLPKSSKPSRMPPFLGDLILRFYVEGVLLLFLWEFSSMAFRIFIAEPPLKKGKPLTSDSKDPNGSLLTGLKAKKEYPRTFAFWELAIIASSSAQRRETIYRDIDRVGGSVWSQLVTVCLGELHAVSKRIQDFQNPPVPTADQTQPTDLHQLPRITAPPRTDNIFTNPPPSSHPLASDFGSFAKAHGQSPGASNPISPRARKLIEMGADAVISKETQQALSQSFLGKTARSYITEFLRYPLGWPFRHTFARRATVVVVGGSDSLSNASIIADATKALAKLASCSLTEDRYGRVNRDVANIIRTYVLTVQAIENFVRTLDVHWTDVAFDRRKEPDPNAVASNVFGAGEIEAGRKVAAINEVLGALKEGLETLLNDFGEFREELGLKTAEMRRAREVVGGPVTLNGGVR